MKNKVVTLAAVVFSLSAVAVFGQSLKGMTLNGATGLVSIPSGRIGWERTSDLGFDLGYHGVVDRGQWAHIPKISINLLQLAEFSMMVDTQRRVEDSDLVIGGKIQLPTSGTAVALGGNFQYLRTNDVGTTAGQVYLAATYPGTFFSMPAETTFVIGKTIGENQPNGNIDFGMGFDLVLLPDLFQGYLHWINDFANFSYSAQPFTANARNRGVFNTGIRIDLASNAGLGRFKFVLDAIVTDALDDERAFAVGAAFGIPLR